MALTREVPEVELGCCQGRNDVPGGWVRGDTCHRHCGAHSCRHLPRLPRQEHGQQLPQRPAVIHRHNCRCTIFIEKPIDSHLLAHNESGGWSTRLTSLRCQHHLGACCTYTTVVVQVQKAHQEALRASTKLMRGLLLARPTACRNSSVGETMTGDGRCAYMWPRNLVSCVTACVMTPCLKTCEAQNMAELRDGYPEGVVASLLFYRLDVRACQVADDCLACYPAVPPRLPSVSLASLM